MRQCSAPVMIVAANTWKKKARVLAALDLGSNNRSKRLLNDKIMRISRRLADTLGRQLHCVYAIEVPQLLIDMDLVDEREHTDKLRLAIKPRQQKIEETYGIPADHFYLLRGPAERIIPRVANKLKADIVVIGSVGRKGLRGALMGNTAEGVLSKLRTDILTVTP